MGLSCGVGATQGGGGSGDGEDDGGEGSSILGALSEVLGSLSAVSTSYIYFWTCFLEAEKRKQVTGFKARSLFVSFGDITVDLQ